MYRRQFESSRARTRIDHTHSRRLECTYTRFNLVFIWFRAAHWLCHSPSLERQLIPVRINAARARWMHCDVVPSARQTAHQNVNVEIFDDNCEMAVASVCPFCVGPANLDSSHHTFLLFPRLLHICVHMRWHLMAVTFSHLWPRCQPHHDIIE